MGGRKESIQGENLTRQIIEQYKPQSVEDMQNGLKDIFGPMFKAMLQGEIAQFEQQKGSASANEQKYSGRGCIRYN